MLKLPQYQCPLCAGKVNIEHATAPASKVCIEAHCTQCDAKGMAPVTGVTMNMLTGQGAPEQMAAAYAAAVATALRAMKKE